MSQGAEEMKVRFSKLHLSLRSTRASTSTTLAMLEKRGAPGQLLADLIQPVSPDALKMRVSMRPWPFSTVV